MEDNKEGVVFYLLAKGLKELYEKEEKNYSKLNSKLKRAINILAGESGIIVEDRTDMIAKFSKKIGEWYKEDSIYKNEVFIKDGIPTDFCYEIALNTEDIEGELEQRVILEIRNEFKAYGKEEDYKNFRSYLVKNPISSRERLEKFILKNSGYNSKLKKVYARIYEFYEEIPIHYINNNNIDKDKFNKYIDKIIYKDDTLEEKNINDIINKLKIIFSNRIFIRNLNDARNNWLELPIEEVLKKIYIFFKDMEKITV